MRNTGRDGGKQPRSLPVLFYDMFKKIIIKLFYLKKRNEVINYFLDGEIREEILLGKLSIRVVFTARPGRPGV